MHCSISIEPVGTIHSPHTSLENMPIQPVGAREVEGTAILRPEFAPGLKDLDGFSHIYLLYHFHKAGNMKLEVVPFMDSQARGVFATRSPLRPSGLGMSIVEVLRVEDNVVFLRGVDVLDGTPLLDIKPYIPQFDQRENVRTGWMCGDREDVASARSDKRFV
jgi:tRNA (adenine37-N6)-methyltransferase